MKTSYEATIINSANRYALPLYTDGKKCMQIGWYNFHIVLYYFPQKSI